MPTGHLRHFIEHYLAPHPSAQVKELFQSTAILDFATASVMLFEPVYLRQAGLSIEQILLFFLVLYVAYFLLLPLGGRICRKNGYEHSILYSSPFLILYYLSLFAIPFSRFFIISAIVSLVIQKILYWPGYHANFATWGSADERGREISNRAVISSVASTLAPVFGGLVVAFFGFKSLFGVVAGLILLSNVPLLRTPELFIPKSFAYTGAMKRIFDPAKRRQLFGFMGFGEELIALVLWPIFISLMVPNFVLFGAVISLSMLTTVLVTLYIGRLADEGSRHVLIRTGVVYASASWLIRPLIVGGFGVFLMDAFYRVTKNTMAVPMMAVVYDEGKGDGIMESVVFFEMALSLGKIAAAALGIVILRLFPGSWPAVFIMAAVFTCLFALVREKKK